MDRKEEKGRAMNFTEGKWECNWHAEGQFLGLRQSGCYVICEKPKKGKETVQAIAMLPPGHEANAHLIAAAPELYRACEDLIASINLSDNSFSKALNKIEAALSSAGGGK